EEWIENLLNDRKDLKREKLERTRDLMNKAILDCLVEGYESLIPALTLPDPDDRHVLAAAIKGGAGTIGTFNLPDFPEEILRPRGILAQHPDAFLSQLFDLDPETVCEAAREERLRLRTPPKSVEQYLASLDRLPETVKRLRTTADQL